MLFSLLFLPSSIKKLPATYISVLLRVLNIGNAALLGLACFEAYNIVTSLASGGSVPVTRAFLATYIGIFAAMLAAFEMRVRYTAGFIRKNCGFLFTYTGRACFLVFLGAVCFGMLDDDAKAAADTAYTVCLIVGLITVGNAALNCFIICNHPEFQAMNAPDKAHPAGNAGADPSKMSEEQVRAYLAAHPELAAQVAGANKGGNNFYDNSDHVTVPIDEPTSGNNNTVSEWGTPQGTNNAGTKKSSGGGFFSFGGGKKANTAAVPAKAEIYQPPSVPASQPHYDNQPQQHYTSQAQHHSPVNNQPAANNSNFAISGDDDDNPFAQGDNPFGGR